MGLICPKCGVDNLLTAIFCRGCGEKLDLNEMKPDALLNDEHTKAQRKGASPAQKTFVGVFFGLLGIMVLLAMCPVGSKGMEEGDPDKAIADAFALLNKGKASAAGQGKQKGKKPVKKGKPGQKAAAKMPPLSLDSDTASKLTTQAMGLPKPKEEWTQGPFVPQHFSMDFKAENTIKIVVKAKAFGMLPVVCSAKAVIQKGEGDNAGYDYVMSSPKLGMLPLFVYGELSLDLIQNLMNSCPAFERLKGASEITTEDGMITAKF